MSISIRHIAALAGVTALLGAGTASAQDSSGSYPSSPSGQQGQQGGHGKGHHGRRGPRGLPRLSDAQLQTVADTLGVTLDALKAAIASAKPPAPSSSGSGSYPGSGSSSSTPKRCEGPFAAIAAALGKTTAEVKAAFDAVKPAKPADDRSTTGSRSRR